MKKLAIISRKAPYGDINAAEAVRHAMGGVGDEIEVSLVLVDAGVLLARRGQEVGETGFTDLGEALKDSVDMGVAVYADRGSLREHHMESADVAEGVRVVNGSEVADLVKEADSTMIF
jgi:sulfur relay (sulfurtransferase) DsrF/TusC family protein